MISKLQNLFLVLAVLLFATQAQAQTPSYIFAGGTSNNNFPFNTTTSNKVQWVYLPSDFTPNLQAGLITHVYFRSNNSASTTKSFSDLRISVGHTNITTFPNGTFITGLTTCYGPQTASLTFTSAGWFGVQLATPFVYDGTSNLIIEATITNTTSTTVAQSSAGGNKRIWGGRTASSGSTGSGLTACGLEILTCSTAVTKQPMPVTVCENEAVSFDIDAIDVAKYQWQVDNGSGFVDITSAIDYSGFTTKKLDITNPPFSFNNNNYRCIIFNANNSCSDTSDEVTLNVNGLVSVDSFATNDTTCLNAIKTLEIRGNGSITNYQWQILIPGQGYVDITGQPPYSPMANQLLISGVSDTLDGSKFRCVIQGVCDQVQSNELTLTVNAIPKVAASPTDKVAKQGDNVTFEIQASGQNVRYQWQVSSGGGVFSNVNNNGIYNGVKTSKLKVSGVSYAQNNFEFRCIVSTGDNCIAPGDTSNIGLLIVQEPESIVDIEGNKLVVLYPNPASGDELFIKPTENIVTNTIKYVVTDKTGRTVLIGNINRAGVNKINIGSLAADVYFMQLMDESNQPIAKSKFIKL